MAHKYMQMTVERLKNGVVIFWLDAKGEKINTLSSKLRPDLIAMIEELETNADLKAAVLISKKPGNFVVGADVNELKHFKTAQDATDADAGAQVLFDRIEASSKPIVAAIDGICMGGGMELALGCHYRIATDSPKTQLALPEVKLGILPAAGGCQRVPRLIGLQAGLDMLLTGKTLYPRKAKKLGLIDDVVIPYSLADQAVQVALRLADGFKKQPRKRSIAEQAMEDLTPARDMVFKKAREMVRRQTRGNYPAPLAILDCVQTGIEKGMKAGLKKEADYLGKLLMGPVAKELMNIFFVTVAKKKHPLAEKAPQVGKVGVLGAGLMGAGIGLVSATNAKTDVVLKDVTLEAAAKGVQYAYKVVDKKRKKGVYGAVERDRIMTRIVPTADYNGFENADLVIEAVFEDLDLKRRILNDVEAVIPESCIFASNTSALPIHKIAAGALRPENVIGMHYFSPVHHMPLLEIIVTPATSKRALKMAVGFGVKQGKTVIVVRDEVGFYTTRILAPYLNETALMISEGARIEQIDAAMKDFGYPVGPCVLVDEVGFDVAAHVAADLGAFFSDRGANTSDAFGKLVDGGFLGKKNKRGLYQYGVKQKKFGRIPVGGFGRKPKKMPNEDVYAFFGGSRKAVDAKTIQLRHALAMVNEAAHCLQEKIIESPADGDIGAVFGLGFPPFRGGPFRFADAFGLSKLASTLEQYADRFGAQFKPARILSDYAKKGKTFY
jgi:3-hydroxyacyl-CoA dehydrogenase / enoyl-CoA hydratase / 3-hydroxybutyryl-CoA epimerase